MSELHFVGVSPESRGTIESVDSRFVREGILKARSKSWEVYSKIKSLILEGMTEDDARRLALQVFSDQGVTKHWHKPYIRFGAGTQLTFHDPIQANYRLKQGDPVYIDLGPVWPDPDLGLEYEGDIGDTYVFGENPEAEKCALTARSLFVEVQNLWKSKKLTGEGIYQYLKQRSLELGYKLVENVDGHRLSDFPHHKYSKQRLARLTFDPSSHLWVLEIQINHLTLPFGAFFEDLLE